MNKEELEIAMLEHANKINDCLVMLQTSAPLQGELKEMFERYLKLTQ